MIRLLTPTEAGWGQRTLNAALEIAQQCNDGSSSSVRMVYYVAGRRMVLLSRMFTQISSWRAAVDLIGPAPNPVLYGISEETSYSSKVEIVPYAGPHSMAGGKMQRGYLAWPDGRLVPAVKSKRMTGAYVSLLDLRGNVHVLP